MSFSTRRSPILEPRFRSVTRATPQDNTSQIVLFFGRRTGEPTTVKESFAGDRVENWIQLFSGRWDAARRRRPRIARPSFRFPCAVRALPSRPSFIPIPPMDAMFYFGITHLSGGVARRVTCFSGLRTWKKRTQSCCIWVVCLIVNCFRRKINLEFIKFINLFVIYSKIK